MTRAERASGGERVIGRSRTREGTTFTVVTTRRDAKSARMRSRVAESLRANGGRLRRPPALIRGALRSRADETRHARLIAHLARRRGGQPTRPSSEPRRLAASPTSSRTTPSKAASARPTGPCSPTSRLAERRTPSYAAPSHESPSMRPVTPRCRGRSTVGPCDGSSRESSAGSLAVVKLRPSACTST